MLLGCLVSLAIVPLAAAAPSAGGTIQFGVSANGTTLANVGDHVIWTVVDNGEGKAAPPDQTSDFFPVGPLTAAAHCASGFSLALIPVLGGNLQVHE